MVQNLEKIQNQLIKNLAKKGIILERQSNDKLVWKYEMHYSKFEIVLTFGYSRSYSEECDMIYYSTPDYISTYRTGKKDIGLYKTPINKYLNYRVYHSLIRIQQNHFDRVAKVVKEKTDLKNQYANELERYFKTKYDSVTMKVDSPNSLGEVNIKASCFNKKVSSDYRMVFKENKHYLIAFTEDFYNSDDHSILLKDE